MRILSIDPGIDGIGVAVWDLATFEELRRAVRPEMAAALRSLVGTLTITTSPRDPLEARLAEIVAEVRSLAVEHGAGLAYVETPAYSGDYGNDRGRRAGANKLYMGLGAVLAGLGLLRGRLHVVEFRAGQSSKDDRHLILEQNARVAGIALPEGPRGGKREDELDAMWIGAYALAERVNRDLAEAQRAALEHEPAEVAG